MYRRLRCQGSHSQGLDAVENAAGVAQRYLGWDDERVADEVERYRRYVERFCLSDLSK